jgi:hypothetical protein
MYLLQLDPLSPNATAWSVTWPGYWAGHGFVEDLARAIRFPAKRDASRAMNGLTLGLNGCMKIVRI